MRLLQLDSEKKMCETPYHQQNHPKSPGQGHQGVNINNFW